MNRIYQGRVSKVLDDQSHELDLDVLWQHHKLFQDAVNYYVVCLLALAEPRNEGVWQIRQRLNATAANGEDDELMVWRPFRRRGALRSGMRDSVAPYLCPNKPDATPEDCFAAVLAGNECAQAEEGRARLSDGLRQLLENCTGDSGPRDCSKEYLPRFCRTKSRCNYPESAIARRRAYHEKLMPLVLHFPMTPNSKELEQFNVFSTVLPDYEKPIHAGNDARELLAGMIADLKAKFPAETAELDRLAQLVDQKPDTFRVPGYQGSSAKGEKKLRLYAMFLFRYVKRSEFTLRLLRATTPKPEDDANFAFLVHGQSDPNSLLLNPFTTELIAKRDKKKETFNANESAAKLKDMLDDWRKELPDEADNWQRLATKIGAFQGELPSYAGVQRAKELVENRRLRLFALYLFKYVERSEFTLRLLRLATPKLTPPTRTEMAAGDPVQKSRGQRGYVFRAFTALDCWQPTDPGEPVWLKFDEAALQEALKSLHQINSKKTERADKRATALDRLEYQRQCAFRRETKPDGSEDVDLKVENAERTKKMWKSGGEETTPPPVLVGDPRIARLEWLLSSDPAAGGLAEEYEMSEGVSVEYGLHQRTIRGFRDLRKKWNASLVARDGSENILSILKDYKKDNPELIGSHKLFDALAKEDNWLIWREPTAEEIGQWRKAAGISKDVSFAEDPLQALTDERELIADIERLSGPIRFTPAHPEHSRRQFYFSDVTDLTAKNRLRHDRQTVDVELGIKENGVWKKKDVRLQFSAPRLLRDQLNNACGKDAVFQQAMMEALGIRATLTKTEKSKPRKAEFEECAAVALMPEVRNDGSKRILLNFPLTLDGESIVNQLGKAERWHELQFGGADGESYWLRWPKTWIDEKKDRKKAPPAPWWCNPQPFQVLSVDLGQRVAGAYALIEATPGNPPKPQSRKLGTAGDKTWWATVKAMGVLHLPGEDAKIRRERTRFDENDDNGANGLEELSGRRGRMASPTEWDEARDICAKLGLIADRVMGNELSRYSFPEMNDRLLYALGRAQARLARLQGWSCVAWEEKDDKLKAKFEKRRTRIQEQIAEAIAARAEEAAKPEAEREQESLERGRWLDEAKPLVERNAWDCVADCIIREVRKEREIIQQQLVRIANRVQPLRGEWDDDRVKELVRRLAAETNFNSPVTRSLASELAGFVASGDSAKAVHPIKQHLSRDRNEIPADLLRHAEAVQPFLGRSWKWEQRSDGKNHWLVIEKTGVACFEPVKLAGQRGLSLARIEQLDSLRQRCQSLNRALRQVPGEPARLGRSKRGIELPDPCPDILDRLDALKEQRVNQTAHLIVAQALGVQLKPHEKDEKERIARDIHGEYERIPGRQPVDFIAIENLEYYNMTQRRERSTNARLMKWCRRQLRDKLIELCEPYGLRVVEVWPADTSKFCSLTGVAGFRAVELNPDDAENFPWKKLLDRLREKEAAERELDKDELKESQRIMALFDKLVELNRGLLAERAKARAESRHFRPKWRTLLAPMRLGPIFVPMRGRPMQADVNAAINIGLRAIAAPDADDIYTRIRAKSDSKVFTVRAENSREKARWEKDVPQIAVKNEESRQKLFAEKWLNFYFDFGSVATFDQAVIEEIQVPVSSGRGLWGSVNQAEWCRCEELNAVRLTQG
jgi:hypothetical protein